jgi:hypothetical protein
MSHPEAPQTEAQVETQAEQQVETAREASPGLTQREFLKKLVGSAAGITGLAAAGTLLTPKTAEAAYTTGGSPYPAYLPGDQITTNVHVAGSAAIRGPRPWLDVTAFGASGDWSTPAAPAVNAALASTPGHCILYFPPGIYTFATPINISNRHITLLGAGRGVTYFQFSPGAGFNFTITSSLSEITIRDIHFRTADGHNPHPAIRIESDGWFGPPGMLLGPHIHDVVIDVLQGSSWSKGIELKGVTGARIHDFQILCGGTANSTHGIHLLEGGQPPDVHGSTIASITDGYIFGTQVGIQASHRNTEGLYLRAIEVLDANIGYRLNSPGPGTSISDCHAATTISGINLADHGDMALMGNLLYGGGPSWVGIDCTGTGFNPLTGQVDGFQGPHNLRIIGNQIFGAGIGIRLSGYARNCVIQGNVLIAVATGILLNGPNVTGSVVVNNRIDTAGTPISSSAPPAPTNITSPNY